MDKKTKAPNASEASLDLNTIVKAHAKQPDSSSTSSRPTAVPRGTQPPSSRPSRPPQSSHTSYSTGQTARLTNINRSTSLRPYRPTASLSRVDAHSSNNAPLQSLTKMKTGETKIPAHTTAPPNVKSILMSEHDRRMASRQTHYETLSPVDRVAQESWAQSLIQRASVCPQGFAWARIPGGGGYRCEGQHHIITDELLSEGKGGLWLLPSGDLDDDWYGPYYMDDNAIGGPRFMYGGVQPMPKYAPDGFQESKPIFAPGREPDSSGLRRAFGVPGPSSSRSRAGSGVGIGSLPRVPMPPSGGPGGRRTGSGLSAYSPSGRLAQSQAEDERHLASVRRRNQTLDDMLARARRGH